MMKIRTILPFVLLLTNTLTAQDQHLLDSLTRRFHATHDPVIKVDMYFQMANEREDAENPDKCFLYADTLEALSNTYHQEWGLARAYQIRGNAYLHKGTYSDALPWFNRQLALNQKLNDQEGIAHAYNNIGAVWQEMVVFDSAIGYKLKALEIQERLGDRGNVASQMANIANMYSDIEAYDKAIDLLQRTLAIRKELGEEKRSMFTYNNLAVAYGLKGEYDKSTAYADTGIAIALKYNNKMVAGVICGGMGHVLNETKRYQESIQWCERSLAYLKEVNREQAMVYPYVNMATAYNGLKAYAKALEVNKMGWVIMEKLHLAEPLDPYYENFADAYAGLHDYENAYKWHQIYFTHVDTTTRKDNVSKIANIEAKYNLSKKEQEIAAQRAANFRQTVWTYSLAALLLAVLAFGYLFYNRFRLRQKAELDAAVIREQKLGLNAVIEAQEAERKRIARDLHDGIAQELVALKLGIDAASRRVGKIAPEEAPRFADLSAQINDSCTEVRSIAHTMSPPILEHQGLAPSLELLLHNTTQHAGLDGRFLAHNLPDQLPEKTKIGLYRIAQELLNNVVKHAQAAKVVVELFQQGATLVLKVEDDGQGFDFEQARARGTMGVLNILSRVNTLGGEIIMEKRAPHGTVALIKVPS